MISFPASLPGGGSDFSKHTLLSSQSLNDTRQKRKIFRCWYFYMCIYLPLLYASAAKYCVLNFLGCDQTEHVCEHCICMWNNPDRYALRKKISAKLNLLKKTVFQEGKKIQNWSHCGTYPLFLSVKEFPTEQPHWLKIRRILTGFAVVGSNYHMHCFCSCFFSIRTFYFSLPSPFIAA